jgi:NAD-dependent dihydropyrimidine dehydrogenase PreA subunit
MRYAPSAILNASTVRPFDHAQAWLLASSRLRRGKQDEHTQGGLRSARATAPGEKCRPVRMWFDHLRDSIGRVVVHIHRRSCRACDVMQALCPTRSSFQNHEVPHPAGAPIPLRKKRPQLGEDSELCK